MNLTHLFNKNYFVQNFKKSQAMLLFISLILPVFTLLTLNAFSNTEAGVIKFWQYGICNILFMYVIPIVISVQLFNFVFKKKSCDFVGSMPLSRSTIFTTNTIGGIALIVLIQLATAVISLIFSKLFSVNILFSSMVWDAFVFFTIAYIFVFVTCNLAISFSGNVFATIVSLLLILFFVPFLVVCSRINENAYSNKFEISEDAETVQYYNSYNFTAPSYVFSIGVFDNDDYAYNREVVAKTAILSVFYFFIGLYLFNKKKYELAEESYESDTVHIVMKFLTLAPFIAILAIDEVYKNGVALMFFVAIIAVYYFLFDMITNKKIKPLITISAFFISSLAMFAIFKIVVPGLNGFYLRTFEISNVKSITIDEIRIYSGYYSDFRLKVDDEKTIKDILMDSNYFYRYSPYANGYSDVDTKLTITMDNGKKIKIYKYLGDSFKHALEKYGDEKYKSSYLEMVPYIDGIKFTNEEKQLIKDCIKADLDNISYNDYFEIFKKGKEAYYLLLAKYENHELITTDISYSGFKNTNKEAIKILNNNAVKRVSVSHNLSNWNISRRDDLIRVLLKSNPDVLFSDLDDFDEDYWGTDLFRIPEEARSDYKYDYDYEKTTNGIITNAFELINDDQIREFILDRKDEEFDETKPYIVLQSYVSSNIIFYSNDVEGLYKLLAKAYNESNYGEYTHIKLNENI